MKLGMVFCVVGLFVTTLAPAYADMSAKSFFKYKERAKYNTGAKKSLTIYLDGVAAGVNAAETLYFQKFESELLCPPKDQVIDDEEVLAVLQWQARDLGRDRLAGGVG